MTGFPPEISITCVPQTVTWEQFELPRHCPSPAAVLSSTPLLECSRMLAQRTHPNSRTTPFPRESCTSRHSLRSTAAETLLIYLLLPPLPFSLNPYSMPCLHMHPALSDFYRRLPSAFLVEPVTPAHHNQRCALLFRDSTRKSSASSRPTNEGAKSYSVPNRLYLGAFSPPPAWMRSQGIY